MRLELNHQINMQFKTIFHKIYPWIGLIGSLCLIIPNLYDIIDEPFTLSNAHLIFAAGLLSMLVFLKQIFDRIINLE
jgi:hypothetical protein